MSGWLTNRKTRKKFKVTDSELAKLIDQTEKGSKMAEDFPHTIVFDWNGTVDARNTGVGVPLNVLIAMRKLGKNVIVYTSSVDAPGKEFMRKTLEANDIPFTDNAEVLKYADVYVADAPSDERRAGKYGVKFVYTQEFDLAKLLPKELKKKGHEEALNVDYTLPIEDRIVAEVKDYNKRYGIASAADVLTELNSRGRDAKFQGELDFYADAGEEEFKKKLDALVADGRLKKVKVPGAKEGYVAK